MRPSLFAGFGGLRLVLLALWLEALSACAHPGAELQISPEAMPGSSATTEAPIDPFPTESANSAYARLRTGTDQARALRWDGQLDSFGPWLEGQTQSIEDSLRRLAELRTGRADQYGVASGRVALTYEHIATALDRASGLAKDADMQAEWDALGPVLWERAQRFWERCAKLTAAGAPHLDAWEMRCTNAAEAALRAPARQSK